MRALFTALMLLTSSFAVAGETDAEVMAHLSAEGRPAADCARDPNRKPLETLKFLGLEDDMRIPESRLSQQPN